MKGQGYMAKAGRTDWRTPRELLGWLHLVWPERGIELDPCASKDPRYHFADSNFAGPPAGVDGLTAPWGGRTCYVNPPFRELSRWCAKIVVEVEAGADVVLLCPSRTDTRWWHREVRSSFAVCFLRGRLHFDGDELPCPFPTTLVYWGRAPRLFSTVLHERGWVVPADASWMTPSSTSSATGSST